jgi:hypothetical protein
MPENKPLSVKHMDTDRILGVLLAIGGIAAVYYFIIRQALIAMRHESGIFFSSKAVMCSPVVFGVGIVLTVFGGRATAFLGDNKQRPTKTTYILILLFCVADMLLCQWLRSFIEGYGYEFSYRPSA